jgi:hypothetical protein
MKKTEIVFSLRILENSYKKLKFISVKEQRSINSQLLYYIKKGIESYEKDCGVISLKD